MKYLFYLIMVIVPYLQTFAQVLRPNPVPVLLTDYSIQSSDTAYIFVYVGRQTSEGSIVDAHVVLEGIDCIDSWWMVGETNVSNKAPIWIESSGSFTFPLVIDTTATNTASQLKFKPLPYDDTWSFLIKWQWNGQYMTFATYKGGCTEGKATLYY